jgi:DNA/RNA-binding domain of Phe-tRNA-synthetase-like protein
MAESKEVFSDQRVVENYRHLYDLLDAEPE